MRVEASWMRLLVLLLSHFSRVRLCATPETAALQAPPSLGFSRQEHWSGLPFPSPMHESEKWKWSRSVCSTLSDPMDCSLPGSSIHGIFQAKVLEWGDTAFSMNETSALKRRGQRTSSLSFLHVRIQEVISHLQPWPWFRTRTWPCWHADFRLPASKTVRNVCH